MGKIIYNEGDVVGKLIFIKEVDKKNKARYALFKCSCGKEFSTYIQNAVRLGTTSCGCYKSKVMVERKHNSWHG